MQTVLLLKVYHSFLLVLVLISLSACLSQICLLFRPCLLLSVSATISVSAFPSYLSHHLTLFLVQLVGVDTNLLPSLILFSRSFFLSLVLILLPPSPLLSSLCLLFVFLSPPLSFCLSLHVLEYCYLSLLKMKISSGTGA